VRAGGVTGMGGAGLGDCAAAMERVWGWEVLGAVGCGGGESEHLAFIKINSEFSGAGFHLRW